MPNQTKLKRIRREEGDETPVENPQIQEEEKAALTAALAKATQEIAGLQTMVDNLKQARQTMEAISVDGQKRIEDLTRANAGLTRTNEQYLAKNQELEKLAARAEGRAKDAENGTGARKDVELLNQVRVQAEHIKLLQEQIRFLQTLCLQITKNSG
jgi:hypothetical protein